jgi:hypothetical protein
MIYRINFIFSLWLWNTPLVRFWHRLAGATSPLARIAAGSRSCSKIYCTDWINNNLLRVAFVLKSPFPLRWAIVMNGVAVD